MAVHADGSIAHPGLHGHAMDTRFVSFGDFLVTGAAGFRHLPVIHAGARVPCGINVVIAVAVVAIRRLGASPRRWLVRAHFSRTNRLGEQRESDAAKGIRHRCGIWRRYWQAFWPQPENLPHWRLSHCESCRGKIRNSARRDRLFWRLARECCRQTVSLPPRDTPGTWRGQVFPLSPVRGRCHGRRRKRFRRAGSGRWRQRTWIHPCGRWNIPPWRFSPDAGNP